LNLDDHYRVLGLPPGSAFALIKKIYLREIKIWHPDRYAPDSILREQAEERTKALTAAYAALRAALGDGQSDEAPPQAEPAATAGRDQHSGPSPNSGLTGWPWFQRFWQDLKQPRSARATKAGSAAAAQRHSRESSATGRERRRKTSTFSEYLDEARGQSGSFSSRAVAWRRLAAKRLRYRRRRGESGTSPIDPIRPRGPVTPVKPIRPIGDDG
jgi:curved DNA-binding protein CbpA